MAEANLLVQSADNVATARVGFLQADWELIQGLHLIFTGEALRQTYVNSYGAWFSVSWFFFPSARRGLTSRSTSTESRAAGTSQPGSRQLHFSM